MKEEELIERLTRVVSKLDEEKQNEVTEAWQIIYLRMLSMFVNKVEREHQEEGR